MTKDEALNIAIDYMNERLEEHDAKFQRHPVAEAERNNILADIKAVIEALSQPKQEPVAWVHHLTFKNLNSFERSRYSTTLAKKQTDACCIPLYTNPPQRTWVGLTDEEIQYCVELKNPEAIAEEVEAKLKEKNT